MRFCSRSAVDRSVTASLGDARDALINAAIDTLASYRSSVLSVQQPGLLAPACLRLFPLYILALLKHVRQPERRSSAVTPPSHTDRLFSFRKPSGRAPAPGWTSACLPCVS